MTFEIVGERSLNDESGLLEASASLSDDGHDWNILLDKSVSLLDFFLKHLDSSPELDGIVLKEAVVLLELESFVIQLLLVQLLELVR